MKADMLLPPEIKYLSLTLFKCLSDGLNRFLKHKRRPPNYLLFLSSSYIAHMSDSRAAVKRAQTKHDRDRQMMDPFYFQKMPHIYEGADK